MCWTAGEPMKFDKTIPIENKTVGGREAFIIAEIGSNHNQNISLAYELIDAAAECGADAVKFQSIKSESIYRVEDLNHSEKELLEKIELKENWYKRIQAYCLRKKMIWFSSPTYLEAVDLLVNQGVKLMKIASPQTYGFPQLIKKVGETGLPTIMSTGYCSLREIERAADVFKKTGNKKLVLLHCISNYPTDYENVYLNHLKNLQKRFGAVIGFSDHTLGCHIAVAAVAIGAKVIEKHLTLSRSMAGPDHHFAAEPNEFKEMVVSIRDTEKAMGDGRKKGVSYFERSLRDELEMKICVKEDINKDEVITEEKLLYLRNKRKSGISAWRQCEVVGKRAKIKLKKNTFIEIDDIY